MCLWWFVRSFRLSPSFRTQNPSREVSGALEKKTFRERRFHFALRCKNKSSVTLVYRIFTTHKDTQLLGILFFFLVAPMCIVLGCSSSLCDSKAQFRVPNSQGNPFSFGFPPFSTPSHTHSEYLPLVSSFRG